MYSYMKLKPFEFLNYTEHVAQQTIGAFLIDIELTIV